MKQKSSMERIAGARNHLVLFTILILAATASAQDWIRTGTGLGVEKIRLAASDFKPATQDPKNTDLLKTFNDTLFNEKCSRPKNASPIAVTSRYCAPWATIATASAGSRGMPQTDSDATANS